MELGYFLPVIMFVVYGILVVLGGQVLIELSSFCAPSGACSSSKGGVVRQTFPDRE
jgi:hypothetical protein